MGAEVALGQDQDARCPMGLELVKSATRTFQRFDVLEVGRT
jgi:hypothetical protein